MKNYYKILKLLLEREEQEQNFKIYGWTKNVFPKLGFIEQEQYGTMHYWTKEISSSAKIYIVMYISQGAPESIEIYGQFLKNNKWETFPKEKYQKINFNNTDLQELFKNILKKIDFISNWIRNKIV